MSRSSQSGWEEESDPLCTHQGWHHTRLGSAEQARHPHHVGLVGGHTFGSVADSPSVDGRTGCRAERAAAGQLHEAPTGTQDDPVGLTVEV